MAKRKPVASAVPASPTAESSVQHATPGSATVTINAASPTAEYTVLARRCRPQQFRDLVGQEPVAQALINALQSQRVAHAYLFTGARGVGKTSTARILAKALNCVNGPTATPCDVCDVCKSIAAGEDIDVLEIDGASNRRIDEIREIRGNVQYRPSRARYKIYIIDEVHMLTREAFNALLKTLEEPPPHVKFIFATTEVEKVPLTILSRCQRFEFVGIGLSRIVERLRAIVQDEGMECEDEALELIARRAAGSMRDAQSLLDQLLSFGEKSLKLTDVQQLLGTAHDERVFSLAHALLEQDPRRALEELDAAYGEGLQLGELLEQLVFYWRDLMVVSCAGTDAPNLNVPQRQRQTLLKQAEALSLDTILAGLEILSTTKSRLRGCNHPRVLVEMAFVRLGRLGQLVALSQLADWLETPAGETGRGNATARTAPTPAANSSLRAARSVEPPEAGKKKLADDAPASDSIVSAEEFAEKLTDLWPELVRQLGPILASSVEKAGLPAIIAPHSLVLRFPPEYNAQHSHCLDSRNLDRIEEDLRKRTQATWKVRVELLGGQEAGSMKASADAGAEPMRSRRQEFEQEPLLRQAIDVLGARLVREDPGFGALPAQAAATTSVTDEEEG